MQPGETGGNLDQEILADILHQKDVEDLSDKQNKVWWDSSSQAAANVGDQSVWSILIA